MDRRVTREEVQNRIGPIPDGFTLYFEPRAEMLPRPLASLHLDAVATDGRRGVVYEIAVGRRALQDERKVEKLRHLRNAIQSIQGWSFELVIVPEPPPETFPLVEVDQRIAEIESLLMAIPDHPRSSVQFDGLFLVGFAILESCLAMIASGNGIDYRPLAAGLGAALTEEGVLSQEQLDKIRAAQNKRNGLAHGARQIRATRKDVLDLIGLARELRNLVDQSHGG